MPKTITIKLWYDRKEEVEEAYLYADIDRDGEVFYKIQGKYKDKQFMVYYSYDQHQALDEYLHIMEKLLIAQTEALRSA